MTILVPRSASITVDGDDVEFAQDAGTVTLDERTTYAQANVVLALNDTTAEIDPRVPIRAVIEAEANGGAPRTFDLGVRERTIAHAAKTVQLRLASDEELLADWAPFEDDYGLLAELQLMFGGALSAGNIVNYVLERVLPGTDLDYVSTDPLFPVAWESANLIPNPGAETGAHGMSVNDVSVAQSNLWAASETYSFLLFGPTSADSYGYMNLFSLGASKDRTYTASGSVFINTPLGGSSSTLRRSIAVIITTSTGPVVFQSERAPNVTGVTRLAVKFRIPANALSAALFFYHGHTVGDIWWDDLRLSEDDGINLSDIGRLDGAKPDDISYSYEWDDTPGNSVSRRTPLYAEASPAESLIWRAGVSAWDFLLPITNAVQRRLYCDELRTWRLVDTEWTVAGDIEVSTSNAARGDDTISRDGNLWATGVLARYTWEDKFGAVQVKTDYAGVEGKVALVEFDSPYPGPGGAAAILARLQGQGRSQTVGDVIVDYTATPAMGATIALPGTPDQIGRLVAVTFDLNRGRMDLEARGLTDV